MNDRAPDVFPLKFKQEAVIQAMTAHFLQALLFAHDLAFRELSFRRYRHDASAIERRYHTCRVRQVAHVAGTKFMAGLK